MSKQLCCDDPVIVDCDCGDCDPPPMGGERCKQCGELVLV